MGRINMTIERFPKDSEYFFLSNMYPIPGSIEAEEGLRVPTAEHIYQATKFISGFDRLEVYSAPDGYEAKSVSSRIQQEGALVRKDWAPDVKVELMKQVLEIKFALNSLMASKLLSTGEEGIEEGNTWGDRFWGVSPPGSGIGMNMLGRLIMDRRDQLRSQRTGKYIMSASAGGGKSHSIQLFASPEDQKNK
jgi:ribA/ribD-fused uncharacterized protein